MRTQRKFLAQIMAFILTLSIIPTTALADEADYSSEASLASAQQRYQQEGNENFWYVGGDSTKDAVYAYLTDSTQIENQTFYAMHIVGSGKMSDFNVTNSGEDSRPYKDYAAVIKELEIEDGVTYIGGRTMKLGSSLESVTIADSVETMGQQIFHSCGKLTSVNGGNGLKELSRSTFEGTAIVTYAVPDSVETIGEYVFLNCSNLKQVSFGENVKTIKNGAFQLCESLDNVIIPNTVTMLEKAVFYGCSSLKSVEFEEPCLLTNVPKQTFQFSGIEKVIIPEGITTIDENAFYNNIQVLVLPKSVVTIDEDAIKITGDSNCIIYAESSVLKKLSSTNKIIAIATDENDAVNIEKTGFDAVSRIGYIPTWHKDDEECKDESIVTTYETGHIYFIKWTECTHDNNTSWLAATCTEPKTCSKCGKVEGETLEHRWDAGVVTTPASYTAPGVKTFTCAVCNITKTESIPQLIHTASGSSGSSSGYAVSVPGTKNGTVTVSPKRAEKGGTVTITVKPNDGYELNKLTVTDKNGDRIKVTEGKNGKFTFTMPASKVTIEADFAKAQETPDQRFTDVPAGYWAEDAIEWAADNGYMNGNTATTFDPEGSVTRQQLWMILARLSGYQPADFAEAKAWAVDNRVSDGTNPGNAVTRQQLVTILYRYAVMMGYKTTGAADLTRFPDHASVAAYATDAMSWSVANGIVGGTTAGTLDPTGTATRAQFAVILYRFCEKVVG